MMLFYQQSEDAGVWNRINILSDAFFFVINLYKHAGVKAVSGCS